MVLIFKKIRDEIKSHVKLINFTILSLFAEALIFLVPLIIAKFVQANIYGSYSLGMMIIFFATSLFLSSSATPFIISANKEYKKTKSISKSFTNQLLFFLISLGTLAIIFLIFYPFISDFTGLDKNILIYLYLAFVGISLLSLMGNYFLGMDQKNTSVQIDIYYGVLLLFFLFILPFNLQNIFLTYFLSAIAVFIFTIPKIRFKLLFPLKFDKKMFDKHWNFTKWQMFGLTAVYFINWGDSIIINYFLSLNEVGVYNLAYQIFKGIISIMYIINTFYLPDISKNISNQKYLQTYLYKNRILFTILGLFIVLIGIIISPFFLNYFFDESYSMAPIILQVLLIGSVFKLWSIFYNPLFNVLNLYKFLQLMNIFQIILNIILGIILIHPWGIVGVAIATTISYIFRTIIDEIYFHTKVKKKIFNKKKKKN